MRTWKTFYAIQDAIDEAQYRANWSNYDLPPPPSRSQGNRHDEPTGQTTTTTAQRRAGLEQDLNRIRDALALFQSQLAETATPQQRQRLGDSMVELARQEGRIAYQIETLENEGS